MSLVEVLPTEPGDAHRARAARRQLARPAARQPRQRRGRVGRLDHTGAAAGGRQARPACSGATTTPHAPSSIARSRERAAVAVLARDAEEQIPRCRQPRVDDRSCRPLRRPVRAGTGDEPSRAGGSDLLCGQLDHRSCARRRHRVSRPQRLAGNLAVVEWDLPPALELLALLVPLAGQDHHVARLRQLDRPLDRLAAVGLDLQLRRVAAQRRRDLSAPRTISSMIAAGSSERGLSLVMTTRSE